MERFQKFINNVSVNVPEILDIPLWFSQESFRIILSFSRKSLWNDGKKSILSLFTVFCPTSWDSSGHSYGILPEILLIYYQISIGDYSDFRMQSLCHSSEKYSWFFLWFISEFPWKSSKILGGIFRKFLFKSNGNLIRILPDISLGILKNTSEILSETFLILHKNKITLKLFRKFRLNFFHKYFWSSSGHCFAIIPEIFKEYFRMS